MTDQKAIKDFVEAMSQSRKGTSGYDTTAEVVRVEGSTAWVHIPGGVDETPVAMSINAKPGDTVRVRVAGGQAWTVGNDTAPPTDDTAANEAQDAIDKVGGFLDTHLTLKNDGLYVTSMKMGWRVRIANDGVYIINENDDVVAEYKDEIRLGEADSSAIRIASQRIRMDDASGTPIFDVNLMNDADGTATMGAASTLQAGFTGPVSVGHSISEMIGLYDNDGNYVQTPTVYDAASGIVLIQTAITTTGLYRIVYKTTDTIFNATIGTRDSTRGVGDGSVTLGEGNAAMARNSAAIGSGAVSNYNSQLAVGRYNAIDYAGEKAFIVGNGSSSSRSNALSVDWDGDVHAAGDVEDGNGNVLANKIEASDLSGIQGDITSLDGRVDALEAKKTWIVERHTYTYSASGNGTVNITKNQLGITNKTGYTIAGYVSISTGHNNVIPRSWNAQSSQTGTSIALRNVSSSSANNQTLIVDVLYLLTADSGT